MKTTGLEPGQTVFFHHYDNDRREFIVLTAVLDRWDIAGECWYLRDCPVVWIYPEDIAGVDAAVQEALQKYRKN